MSTLAPKTAGQKVIDMLPETPASILDRDQHDGISLDGGDASTEPIMVAAPVAAEPVPNTQAAVEFLLGRPGFPVLSFAQILAEGKKGKFETRPFPERNPAELFDWIEPRQGKGNLYYSINPVINAQAKKADRENIASLASLHVDLDPRVDEPQEKAQARIIAKLKALPKPPTWIIVSGGGVQGIWDLVEHVPINGSLEIAEDLKLYNVQLERDLGGDHCHNIDRIMRIPGTVNVPDERKIKKGRKPAVAYVHARNVTNYTLADFKKAKPAVADEPAAAPGKAAAAPVVIAAPIVAAPRVENVNDDPRTANLKDWVKQAIVHGNADGKTWPTRSEMMYAVSCEFQRDKIANEVFATIVTDPQWKISESVLEKKNPAREVSRLIDRAAEAIKDPQMFALNEQFSVVKLKGKTLIASFEENANGFSEVGFQSFEAFAQFQNKYRRIETVRKEDGSTSVVVTKLGDFWLNNSRRTQYNGIKYIPHSDERVVGGYLNLYQGFSVSPIKGDKHQGFLDHAKTNLCRGVPEYYDYLISRAAWIAQTRQRSGVVMFLRSAEEGTRKTFYCEVMAYLYAAHARKVSREEHVAGKFNAHLQACSYLVAEELSITADGKLDGAFKDLATSETLTVEPKTIDAFQAPNFLNIDVTSNKLQVITASQTARRYFILNVGTAHRSDFEYFDKIKVDLKAGGYENLLYFLLNLDLTGFNVRKVPQTDALAEQKAQSRDGVDALIEYVCNVGQVPCSTHKQPSIADTYGTKHGEGFWAWAKHTFKDLRDRSPQSIATALKKWGFKGVDSGGRTGLQFPALAELRKLFEHHHGAQDWTINDRDEWLRPPQDINHRGNR